MYLSKFEVWRENVHFWRISTPDIDHKNMMVSYMYVFLDVFLICHFVRTTLDIDKKNMAYIISV